MKIISKIKEIAKIAIGFLKKYAPEVLTFVGTCLGTLAMIFSNKMSMSQKFKDIREIEDKTSRVKKTIVAYIPSSILYISSVACYIGSCIIARKYLKGALSALATATAALASYREEVREEVGEEKEKEIFERAMSKIDTQRWDPTLGGWDNISYTVTPVDNCPNYISIPICELEWRFRDRSIDEWVAMVERTMNDMLACRGYITINELVCDICGLDPIIEWSRIGWIKDPNVKRTVILKPHYDNTMKLIPFSDRDDPLTIEFHPQGYIGTDTVKGCAEKYVKEVV